MRVPHRYLVSREVYTTGDKKFSPVPHLHAIASVVADRYEWDREESAYKFYVEETGFWRGTTRRLVASFPAHNLLSNLRLVIREV